MSPTSERILRFTGIALAIVLVSLALYPGTFASPYVGGGDSLEYTHTIVPESSPTYDEYTEGYDHEVYRYDDLSPAARELFDRTRAAEPRPQYNGERQYVPDVCREFLLVCDTYSEDEMPEEFTYGTELDYEEAFVFVEDGDERYLLRTGITGHRFLAPFPAGFVLSWLTMLPLAAFVAAVTLLADRDRPRLAVVGGGALVAALGVLAPYAEFTGLASAWMIGVPLMVLVWLAILGTGGAVLYQRVGGDDGPGSTDGA